MTDSRIRRAQRLIDARVAARPPSPEVRTRQASDAWRSGSATIEQVTMIFGAEIAGRREELVAMAPALAARERRDVWAWGWSRALGYPPDATLPPDVQELLDFVFDEAETPLSEKKGDRYTTAARDRSKAVFACAIVGDRHALLLRRQIWCIEGDRWRLTDATLEAGRAATLSQSAASQFVGLHGDHYCVQRAVEAGDLPTVGTADCIEFRSVTYTDLADAFDRRGWGSGSQSWSDQVRSGQ